MPNEKKLDKAEKLAEADRKKAFLQNLESDDATLKKNLADSADNPQILLDREKGRFKDDR